jgi:hypothetical protein
MIQRASLELGNMSFKTDTPPDDAVGENAPSRADTHRDSFSLGCVKQDRPKYPFWWKFGERRGRVDTPRFRAFLLVGDLARIPHLRDDAPTSSELPSF